MPNESKTTVESIVLSAEARMRRMAHLIDYNRKRELLRQARRNHPKRHSENKERSFRDATNARLQRDAQTAYNKARKDFIVAAKIYWSGQGDHP